MPLMNNAGYGMREAQFPDKLGLSQINLVYLLINEIAIIC